MNVFTYESLPAWMKELCVDAEARLIASGTARPTWDQIRREAVRTHRERLEAEKKGAAACKTD